MPCLVTGNFYLLFKSSAVEDEGGLLYKHLNVSVRGKNDGRRTASCFAHLSANKIAKQRAISIIGWFLNENGHDSNKICASRFEQYLREVDSD